MILMILINKHAAWQATTFLMEAVAIIAGIVGWLWIYTKLDEDEKHPGRFTIFLSLSLLIGGWLVLYLIFNGIDCSNSI